MCQLHAADCLILILNDICSVVSGAASCHYGAPMWPRFGPNKSHPLKLSTLIWCKQSDWQSKHALLFKHKHKQAHSWHMFYSWQWIVTQYYALKLLQQNVGLFSGEIGDATSLRMNKARNIVMCWIFVSPLILEASWRKGYLPTCCRIVIFSCWHQPVVGKISPKMYKTVF